MVHFHPSDFALPYFLDVVHGGDLPPSSFVKDTRDMLDAFKESTEYGVTAFRRLAKTHPGIYQHYSFLRTQTSLVHPEIGMLLAENIPLGTAIWYLEELNTGSRNLEVPNIVSKRLKSEENWMGFDSKITNSFGKLVERILTFQSRKWKPLAKLLMPAAELRLHALKEEFSMCLAPTKGNARTAVFGDASSSMQSAIEAAPILATMVSVCWNGELSFFYSTFQSSPHPRPTTVEQILEICHKVKATGCTSIAAALGPYFREKRVLDKIVLVTDEGENTNWEHYSFGSLLKAYKETVSPDVELIIVGVGCGDLRFKQSLTKHGLAYKRLEIDGSRPDLTKFDALLGQIAMASSDVTQQVEVIEDGEGDFVML